VQVSLLGQRAGAEIMPEIGEIKSRKQIGRFGWNALIWHACIDCGKERWVELSMGNPQHLRCLKCARQIQRGANNSHWNGGRTIDHYNYIYVLLPRDDFFRPMANSHGYVREHRLVVAKALNRCLLPWEVVHHKGVKYSLGSIENRQDNRYPENLKLLGGEGSHNTMLDKWCRKLQKENTQLRQLLNEHNITIPSLRVTPRDFSRPLTPSPGMP